MSYGEKEPQPWEYLRRRGRAEAAVLTGWLRGAFVLPVGDRPGVRHHSAASTRRMVLQALRERPVLQGFLATLDQRSRVWDVGGNLGTWAVACSSYEPWADVVSFEPHAPAAQVLQERGSRWGFEVHRHALGAKARTAEFPATDKVHGSHAETDQGRTVEVVPAGEIPAAPTHLKVDVEGAGPKVLEGFRPGQREAFEVLMLEAHGNAPDLLEHVPAGWRVRTFSSGDAAPKRFLAVSPSKDTQAAEGLMAHGAIDG